MDENQVIAKAEYTETAEKEQKRSSFCCFRKNSGPRVRHRVEIHYFVRFSLTLLLPLLIVVFMMTGMMISDNEESARQRLYTALDNVMENLDAEINHLANTTMQTAANTVFKNSLPKELPAAFESIRDTLENIMSSNRLFQQGSVSFYSNTTPTLFYTEMGTFNENYFRFYELDNGATISIRTVLENTEYMRILPYHAIHSNYATVPSLDVIYALNGQPGSFMIYSIPQVKLEKLLIQDMYHPEEVYLLNAAGNKLYPIDQEKTEALATLRDMLDEEMDSESVTLQDGRELVMVQSSLSGLCLAYVLPKADIFGNVRQLSNMLYVALAFIAILGALLITVLSFWNARPIREILYLTERLSPDETAPADEAALDRIQTILIQLYSDRESSADTLEPIVSPDREETPAVTDDDLLLETEDETMPVSNQENQQCESVLIRQVMAFIDQHQEDGCLSVSMLADTFHMEISNLSHQFKNRTGYALSDYLNARKLDVACAKLRDTRLPVAAIAENLGYAHASSFIRMFKKVYGITPTQFRLEAQAQANAQLSDSEE